MFSKEELYKARIELKNNYLNISRAFNRDFMKRYTNFNTFEEFLENANLGPSILNIIDISIDDYIASNTKFKTWDDMLFSAIHMYLEEVNIN